jgi:hypothetical protein
MSSREELTCPIAQHDAFWRHDEAASRRNPGGTVTTRRRTRRLLEEKARGNPAERHR